MTFYYRPTVTDAFASVQYIMTEANFGWLIRSVHRWSASMMVLMMILHVFRVYLTGGFKNPREQNIYIYIYINIWLSLKLHDPNHSPNQKR
jgi:quinol-cytochrome oxidoreductase complex cytochrome b subunit